MIRAGNSMGDWETCQECGGEGEVIDCPDDFCHGTGKCIHGDMRTCSSCHGEGEIWVEYPEDDDSSEVETRKGDRDG